jgi:hypothetical protein
MALLIVVSFSAGFCTGALVFTGILRPWSKEKSAG